MRLELNHNAEQNIDQEMAYLRWFSTQYCGSFLEYPFLQGGEGFFCEFSERSNWYGLCVWCRCGHKSELEISHAIMRFGLRARLKLAQFTCSGRAEALYLMLLRYDKVAS